MSDSIKIEITPEMFFNLIDNLGKHFRCDVHIEYSEDEYPIYARDESYRTNQVGLDIKSHFYVVISPIST